MVFNSIFISKLFPFIAFVLLSSSDVNICNGRHIELRMSQETPNSVLPEDGLEVGVSHGHLCSTQVKQMEVKSNEPYEFRPRFYTEILCTNAIFLDGAVLIDGAKSQPCSTLKMHCIQQHRIVQLMRRRTDDPDACWEPAHMEIKVPYGCECMYRHEDTRFI